MENNQASCDFDSVLADKISEYDDTLVSDNTDFVYVDGEEGDHGSIHYSTPDGELVYTRNIYGGDMESIALTEFGRAKLKSIYIEAVAAVFD